MSIEQILQLGVEAQRAFIERNIALDRAMGTGKSALEVLDEKPTEDHKESS